jgi:TetR/AcrR family transcriptional repressor of nem operon
MTPTTTVARGRGRPREFDEDVVLDALVGLFWERGFEAASIADIAEVAGLNKSSLYNAFGSKEELFRRVLDRYIAGRGAALAQITAGERGLDALLDLIDAVQAEAVSEVGRLGCFAVNATAELGVASADIVEVSEGYRDILRTNVRGPLRNAAELGEISPDLVDVYVDTCLSYLLATALSARGGASDEELTRHLDSMRTLVESWRMSRPPRDALPSDGGAAASPQPAV